MTNTMQQQDAKWPLWQKLAFRFFCIYFLLQITPWTWLNSFVKPLNYVTNFYSLFINWVVNLLNTYWFHFEKTNIVNNGSGDTSENWKQVFAFLTIALIFSLLWGVIDRKRNSYQTANYWLRTFLRYYLIMMCFIYGIDKLYALQMPFPNQSQLATPLGDFLPMRFSWMFIGYSTPYEMFSGAMEVLAGLLLLNRRTITLGLFVGLAVLTNVMVLNLCYDIPVKLFSMHLVIYCLYLLFNDCKRLFDFFVFNKAVPENTINEFRFAKKWMRITGIVMKIVFLGLFVITPFFTTREFYKSLVKTGNSGQIRPGLYDVTVFALNKDTIPALIKDTLRWKDVVFEKDGGGSVGSTDTSFRQRYRRGYFNFIPDSSKQTILFKKSTNTIFTLHYNLPDSNTITLWGSNKRDSLYVVLKKSNRHFQLAERQFHWISEANR